MHRTVGRPRVYPKSDRLVVYLPEADMRYVDMMTAVMNVSRSEFVRLLLSATRAHLGEKE
jgi:hypothetical protein